MLVPIVDALRTIHREQCYHRDISPANILILDDGRPLLLDFGAARRVIADVTQALTVILTPGYAPMEQYAEAPNLRQGPWTDVYALGAVLFYAIQGAPPSPAVARMVSDPVRPIAELARGRYSDAFLRAIDRALAVKPEQRPQSMEAFADLLGLDALTQVRTIVRDVPGARGARDRSAQPRSRMSILAAIGAVVLVAVGGLLVWLLGTGAPIKPSAPPQPPTAAPTATASPAPETTTSQPPPAPPPPPVRTYTPLAGLDAVWQARDPTHEVQVRVERDRVRIKRDPLRFTVQSSRGGFAYLLMVGTDPTHFYMIFPNQLDRQNRSAPNTSLTLPRPNWQLIAEGPAGTNQFVLVVAESPRDFSHAGARKEGPFLEFDTAIAKQRFEDPNESAAVFAGRAACTPSQPTCSDGYGAARFSIEEVQ